jgi:hypothetical protein
MKRQKCRLPDWHSGTDDSAYGERGKMEEAYFNLLTYAVKVRLPIRMEIAIVPKLRAEFAAVIAPHLDAIAQELAAIETLVVLSVES